MIPRTFDISYKDDRRMTVTAQAISGFAPVFGSKKAALEEGKKFGWTSVLKLEKRFEQVWIVGRQVPFGESCHGIHFDVFQIPELCWTPRADGVKENRVLTVRRPSKK